ncbi:MAG TPA: PAS domain S-box protein, partial [Armatimonadota bacterium]
QAEQALLEAESKYRTLVEGSPFGVYIIQDDHFQYANRHLAEMLGYSEDELSQISVNESIYPEDRGLVAENLRKRYSGEVPTMHYSFRALRKDGQPIEVEVYGSRMVYHGKPAVIGSMIDITERRRAEQREREQEAHKLEFYQRTIMAATDGKLVVTEQAEILKIAGPQIASWEIVQAKDLGNIRHAVRDIAEHKGMDKSRLDRLLVCCGEATTNTFKHAGRGTASLHVVSGDLMIVVSDQGQGIPALSLPEVALTRGYSTAGTLGMGYKLMISYADRIYLATGESGTTVAIQMGLDHREESETDLAHLGGVIPLGKDAIMASLGSIGDGDI